MPYEITVILENDKAYTKQEVLEQLDLLKDDDFEYDVFMLGDHIKIVYDRYTTHQDEAIVDTLSDLSWLGFRYMLRSIEIEREG